MSKLIDGSDCELDCKTKEVLQEKGYAVENFLARGGYGAVFRGKNLQNGQTVAIKLMFLDQVSKSTKKRFLPRELATLMTVKHDNLIHVHDIFLSGSRIFIFMEFATGGDLTGYLRKNGQIPEPKMARWFGQVASALFYLHIDLRLAHRDIKLDNILLIGEIAKLSDYGFATEAWNWKRNAPVLTETYCGTPPYYSPQFLTNSFYSPYAADCFAMGVTLFAGLNDRYPFHFQNAKVHLQEMNQAAFLETRFTKKFDEDLLHLQKGLLLVDESKRFNIKQIVKHPWLKHGGS